MLDKIQELKKALEAGNYNAAPGSLTQGSALQMEDLSNIMNVATFQDSAIKLQKELKVVPAKGTLVQFNRQLDYGVFGGSAVLEGAVGQEETSNIARIVVPMSYYVHVRRVTLQSEMVQTFDGVKAQDRVAADAAIKLAADIEFHLFRGKSAYSNAGLFDGNPLAASELEPGMHGLDMQIRQSDSQSNAKDLMFQEYGADTSVAINQNGVLTQSTIEDIYSRAQMNHGSPEKIYLDPLTHGAYNKVAHGKERIVLAGSPQHATGAQLKEQWVAGGAISIESSRFLSGKTAPARPRLNTPNLPTIATAVAASSTSFIAAEVYSYKVTACNEVGESVASLAASATIVNNGEQVNVTITPAAGISALYFNVYRSLAGGSAVKFIGRVKNSGAATTVFNDLNGRQPAFVTGLALDFRGIEINELSPFKSTELAKTDLTTPQAFYRFCAVSAKLPRFSMLIDNLTQ